MVLVCAAFGRVKEKESQRADCLVGRDEEVARVTWDTERGTCDVRRGGESFADNGRSHMFGIFFHDSIVNQPLAPDGNVVKTLHLEED
jgi:hypothetical protein